VDRLLGEEYQKPVIVKSAPAKRLEAERKVLQYLENHGQLLDRLDDPPVLVLEYLEKNLMEAAHQKRLTRPVIKRVAKSVLEALSALHERGLVHTHSFRTTGVS
jgi:serine/threonine protein kinase